MTRKYDQAIMDEAAEVVYRSYLHYFILGAGALFLCYSFIDFIYYPQLFKTWLLLRLVGFGVFLPFFWFKKWGVSQNITSWYLLGASIVTTSTMNIMIMQSGGISSLYLSGTAVVFVAMVLFLQLSLAQTLVLSAIVFPHNIYILFSTNYAPDIIAPTVLASFPIVTMAILLIYISSRFSYLSAIVMTKIHAQKSEFLSRSFPNQLRKLVLNGKMELEKLSTINDCVIVFIDISSSTQISNRVGHARDWEYKQALLDYACSTSESCGFLLINQMGDGFLLISQSREKNSWESSLLRLFSLLCAHHRSVVSTYKIDSLGIPTGLKCGATLGEVSLGFIGTEQSFYTAIGPSVNLAARLCDKANAWECITHIPGLVEEKASQTVSKYMTSDELTLKGFEGKIKVNKYQLTGEENSTNQNANIAA